MKNLTQICGKFPSGKFAACRQLGEFSHPPRAQAHALAIRARAEMRLAEEYDDAQRSGRSAKTWRRQKQRWGCQRATMKQIRAIVQELDREVQAKD